MRRGHSDQQQHKADGAAEQCETEVGCADSRFNRRKPEKLLWNFPQNRGRNSLAVAKVQEKKTVVRKCISSFMENEPQLDLVVADNVFAFLAMLQKVPGGTGTRSFEDVSPTPKMQGHASADLSSVHKECRSNIQTLAEGDADTPMEIDSKMGHSVETALSCTTSDGDPNHSLDCSLDIQTVEIASKILHDPSNQINAVCSHLKSIASRGPNSVSQVQKSDSQQRGRWCRTILSSLAGAVGLKMLSPKTHWPLLEFVILPWLRLPLEKETRERAPILRGRRWWHLPAKVAMAFSSRFCGPLSNPLAAAHVLLLILELRGKQQEHLAAENQLQRAFCKTCLLQLDQGMHQFALSKGGDKKVQPGWQQKHASAAHHAGGSQGLRCDTCFEKAYEEALQSDQDLPWDWTEEIAQLIACSQNAGTTGCRTTVAPAGEDISQSTVSFNEALDSPGNMLSCSSSSSSLSIEDPSNKGHFWSSSCSSLSTEDPSENALSCTFSCGSFSTEDSPQGVEPASFENKESKAHYKVAATCDGDAASVGLYACEETGVSMEPKGADPDFDVNVNSVTTFDHHSPVSHGQDDGDVNMCTPKVNLQTFVIPCHHEEAVAGSNKAEVAEDSHRLHHFGLDPFFGDKDGRASTTSAVGSCHHVLFCAQEKGFQAGEDSDALENQLLLESMLPEKSDMGVNSPPCTADSDDESFFEASTMSLPDLEFSEEQLLLEAGTHHEIELNQLCSSRTADLDDCATDYCHKISTWNTDTSSHDDIGCDETISAANVQTENLSSKFSQDSNNCDTQESPQVDSEITEHQNGILVTTAGQDLSISTSLAGGDEYADTLKTMQIFSEQEAVRAVSESDTSLQDQILPCAEATSGEDACCSGTGDLSPPVLLLSDSKAVLQSENGGFCPHADHPTCISLRERRHTHGDQKYFTMQELITAPWSELVFWHGQCQQGNPTLCVLLGKAIQKLPAPELSNLVPIIVSHMEYAELNFFKGPSKQVNIVLDLWGLGLMRIPPMDILQRVGTFLNRDYAGRGGSVFVINAPMMLSLVMGGIKRVILCPAYNKGAMIDKGFIESKERIFLLGRQFKPVLEKHFDFTMLPSAFGGQCSCRSGSPSECKVGAEYLASSEVPNPLVGSCNLPTQTSLG